jgi:hypothetical protein
LQVGRTLQKVESDLSPVDAKIVSTSTCELIRMIDPDEVDQKIKDAIAMIGVMTGIKEPPQEMEANVLIMIIKSNYAYLTIEEMVNAFVLNMTGELTEFIKDPKSTGRIEHFHSMNASFATSVLNLYQLRKSAAFKSMTSKRLLIESEESKESESAKPEELFNGLMKFVEENEEVPKFWDWERTFFYMEENGLITIDNEEKKKMKAEVLSELKLRQLSEFASAGSIAERAEAQKITEEKNIQFECRKRIVLLYLQNHIIKIKQQNEKNLQTDLPEQK